MTNTSVRWGLAVGAALMAEITLIIISIIVVAFYSYVVHTGETPAFYQAFAMASGPWVSLIAGGPVFFLTSRWIRRRAGSAARSTAVAQVGLYLAFEVTVLLLWPGNAAATLPLVISGYALKVAGAWLGAVGITARPLSTAV